jgi:hypothetical protein
MANPLEPLAAIAAPIKDLTDLLNKFLSPALQEAGGLVGDRVRVFRIEQEIKLLRKAIQILEEAGLKPNEVKLRVLFPLLNAAVLEEDEDMSERWASLLASAADPNNASTLEASFVEILKQLAPKHAFLLDVFYEQIDRAKLPPEEWNERGFILSILKSYLEKEIPEFDVALDNLLRLHLVKFPTVELGVANGSKVRTHVTSSDILCATSLGYAFVSACGRGRTPRNMGYCVPGNSVSDLYWTKGGSLKISPSPPAKLIPPGTLPHDQYLKIMAEALAVAKESGYSTASVGLIERRLIVNTGKIVLPLEPPRALLDFCTERGLQLEIHQGA